MKNKKVCKLMQIFWNSFKINQIVWDLKVMIKMEYSPNPEDSK